MAKEYDITSKQGERFDLLNLRALFHPQNIMKITFLSPVPPPLPKVTNGN